MKFSDAVFVGDTIHIELEVAEIKPARRMGGGLVTLDVRVVKQNGSVAQKGTWTVLIASKPE